MNFMKKFQEFVENSDYDLALNECAALILEKGIDPNAFQELADIYIEWNPLQILGGVGGSIAGAGLGPAGSLLGATAGSALGRKAGQAVGKFFTKGLAPELMPAFNQAKSSVNNLMQTITKTGQQYPQQIAPLTQHVQSLSQALQQIEPQITQTDQGIKTQHGTDKAAQPQGTSRWDKVKQLGGKARDFVGQGAQKASQWAQKHPGAASVLGTAAGAGLGYMAGNAMSGGQQASGDTGQAMSGDTGQAMSGTGQVHHGGGHYTNPDGTTGWVDPNPISGRVTPAGRSMLQR
jgi:hypothetical protein